MEGTEGEVLTGRRVPNGKRIMVGGVAHFIRMVSFTTLAAVSCKLDELPMPDTFDVQVYDILAAIRERRA